MASKLLTKLTIGRQSLINLSLSLVLFLSVYSVFSFFSQTNKINQLTEEYLWQVNTGIQETTRNYLMPAQFISELSSQLVGSDTLSIDSPGTLESYVAPFSNTYPHLQSFDLGTESDQFWFWLNEPRPGVKYAVRQIEPQQGVMNEQWRFYDGQNTLIDEQTIVGTDYRPTQRPWYRGAKQLRTNFWTDVYMFNAKNLPGITGSHPIFDKEGKIIGVWGVDIAIQELSDFLSDISAARLGEIAILNGDGAVIAYSGDGGLDAHHVELVSIDALGSHALATALASFKNHGFGYFFVNSQDTRYLASVSPLTFPDQQNWQIVIAIPAHTLLGDLLWRTRINGIFVFVFLTALAVLLLLMKVQPNNHSKVHFETE